MRHSILALALFGLLPAAGPLSGQNTAAPTASAAALADVALPPQLDRVLRDYERAWRAQDAAALAALFADDGLVLQNHRPPLRGRAAIQAAYQGQGGTALRLRALAFASEETVGYIIGAYGDGTAQGDLGKFTLTLRRTPGGPWQIVSDMDNPNAPPRRQAHTPAPPPTAAPAR